MAVNKQRLRQMILGDGQHQPAPVPAWLSANQAGASASNAAAVPRQQGYQSSYMARPPPAAAAVGGQEQDQYTEFLALAAVDLARRGATLHGSPRSHEMVAGYKRKRDEQSAPVHGAAHAQQEQQQTIVVDRLLLTHASKMWETLAKQRQMHLRQVTSAAEDRAAQRLKAKDDQMVLLRGVNWALQERIRKLETEAQAWRDAARSNEAAADALRGDLQRALEAQAVRGRGVDDAGSCCWGDNEHEAWKPEAAWWCKGCGQGDAVVLLLPCSHLCVCTPCEAATTTCPACGCAKTGSIRVNFS